MPKLLFKIICVFLLNLLVGGCVEEPSRSDLRELGRVFAHDRLPGEGVFGDGSNVVAEQAVVEASRSVDAAYWVGEGRPSTGNRLLLAERGDLRLYGPRSRDPRVLAVTGVPRSAVVLPGPVFVGWQQDGVASNGGELLGQVFLRSPVQAPLDQCIEVVVGQEGIYKRPLLQGRVSLWPGVKERPLVRHRLLVDLPDDFPEGKLTVHLTLTDCSTGSELAVSSIEVETTSGVPHLEALQLRSGEPDEAARFDGRAPSVEIVDGVGRTTPLPRIRKDAARVVNILGVLDPTQWTGLDPHTQSPLEAISSTISTGVTIVPFEAAASTSGPIPPPAPPWRHPRRVQPSVLATLADSGVDGVLLGSPYVDSASEVGRNETMGAAVDNGLLVPSESVIWLPGQPPFPSVAIVDLTDGEFASAASRLVLARSHAEVALVATSEATIDQLRTVVALGADAVWSVSRSATDANKVVEVFEGVPVVQGLNPLIAGESEFRKQPAELLRWYISPSGVVRMDIVLLKSKGGVVRRDSDGEARGLLVERQRQAFQNGTALLVGRMMASLDVIAHWPTEFEREDLPPPPVATVLSGATASPVIPKRLVGVPFDGGFLIGDGALRLKVDPRQPIPDPKAPIGFDLWWSVEKQPTGRGELVWRGTAEGSEQPWTSLATPGEGVWGFEQWRVGDLIRETHWVWPPRGQVRQSRPEQFSLTVRMYDGGEAKPMRLLTGERHLLVPVVDPVAKQTDLTASKPDGLPEVSISGESR